MHYAFDAEFMVRAALAAGPPELLPDDVLAVRFMHSEQKGAELRRWLPELRRFPQVLGRS